MSGQRPLAARIFRQGHEQNHVTGFTDIFNQKYKAIEAKLVGKTSDQAGGVIQEMTDALKAACEKLHQTEGLIFWTKHGGAFTITVKARGPGGCD